MKQHQQQAPVGGFGLLAEAGPPARINRKDNQVMSYRSYDMPYIQDPTVFKAVMFARKLIREDEPHRAVTVALSALLDRRLYRRLDPVPQQGTDEQP